MSYADYTRHRPEERDYPPRSPEDDDTEQDHPSRTFTGRSHATDPAAVGTPVVTAGAEHGDAATGLNVGPEDDRASPEQTSGSGSSTGGNGHV